MIIQPQPFQTFILIRKNFDVIQDALAKQHRHEKIRMRTYIEKPQADSPVFLEVKSKMKKELAINSV